MGNNLTAVDYRAVGAAIASGIAEVSAAEQRVIAAQMDASDPSGLEPMKQALGAVRRELGLAQVSLLRARGATQQYASLLDAAP